MTQSLVPLKPKQHPVTNLPKFTTDLPFFYLTKQKNALKQNINFDSTDAEGRPMRWKVRPNRDEEIGVPGIYAHEVWVKLIKPALDEAKEQNGGELPSIIPLGSTRECLRTLGWGIGGWEDKRLIQCIYQIAHAACDIDLWLPTIETDEEGKLLFRRIKGSFSRMTLYAIGSTHVTDEDLQSGKFSFDFDLEDTVYIQLHPIEIEIQRHQPQRPVDNEYLFSVSPAARRWYELVAPSLFGVMNNRGSDYCQIRYSWYIERHHTLKRYTERWQVAKQMNQLIKDHRAFRYVKHVDYLEVKEPGQEIDFIIRYWPGEGARESTKRIRGRRGQKRNGRQLELPLPPIDETPPAQRKPTPAISAPTLTEEQDQLSISMDNLVKKLLEHGMHFETAAKLVQSDAEEVTRQLEALPFQPNVKHPARFLVTAITKKYPLPDEYLDFKENERTQRENDERRRAHEAKQRAEKEQEQREEAITRAYLDYLRVRAGEREKTAPEDYQAFLNDEALKRAGVEKEHATKGRQVVRIMLEKIFDDERAHLERFREFFGEPSFDEWQESQSNEADASP